MITVGEITMKASAGIYKLHRELFNLYKCEYVYSYCRVVACRLVITFFTWLMMVS